MIQRSTYSASAGAAQTLGGRPFAVRVSGDPVSANNGIFYFHTDHLGSTSVMTKHSDGYIVTGSMARYTPFGDWRTEPTSDLTDRGFTGHMQNNHSGANDLGLIYMNARFFLPGVARFASADTIVPNPANPQSFNRYSYVRNNPSNLIDPTGHKDCNDLPWECIDENWANDGSSLTPSETLNSYCALNTCTGDGIDYIAANIQGEVIHIPYHIQPDYNSPTSLFPWEAPADVLYVEHGSLHPSHYDSRYPASWRRWFENSWRPEAMGILQTMINRAESSKWAVNTPTEAALANPGQQYSAPYRDVDDVVWQDSYALSFEVIMMGERVNQPYTYYAHQDLNNIRDYVPNDRNAICCTERTGFGPTSGWKEYYVIPLTVTNVNAK